MMIKLFLFSLPFLSFSLFKFSGEDLLVSYFTSALFILNLFIQKKDAKIYFPREAMIFLSFLGYLSIVLAFKYFAGTIIAKNLSQFVVFVIYFIFYLLIVNVLYLQKYRIISKIVSYFVFFCVVFSIYAYFQAFLPSQAMFYTFFRNASSTFNIWSPFLFKTKETYATFLGLQRVTGLAPEPTMWAMFLAVPLALLFPRLYFRFNLKTLAAFLVIFFCLLLTYGRAGWLGLFLALLLFPLFFIKGLKKKIYILSYIVVLIIALFFIFYMDFSLGIDYSKIERFWGMSNAWNMFVHNPVFGVGVGGFETNREGYLFQPGGTYSNGVGGNYAYNFYLRILAETGIVGLFFWILFIRRVFKKIFWTFDYVKRSEDQKTIVSGLGLAFFSILFSWINFDAINFMYIWFIFALITALPGIIMREQKN